MRIEVSNSEAVVKEVFWLAWLACGGPTGMGIHQDPGLATKKQVWDQTLNGRDYAHTDNKPGKVLADYVFGRMMKLRLEWDSTSVTFSDGKPHPDYQAWCRKYPTYQSLVEAAIKSAG